MALTQRFKIGLKFTERRGKGSKAIAREHEIIDVLRTYNSADELVSLRYVTKHKLLGQDVICRDVVDATIAICLAKEGRTLPQEEAA
jgi:hypothetical protein